MHQPAAVNRIGHRPVHGSGVVPDDEVSDLPFMAVHVLGLRGPIPKARKQHFTAPQCGHYGIFSGSRWRKVIYPRVHDFIRKYA